MKIAVTTGFTLPVGGGMKSESISHSRPSSLWLDWLKWVMNHLSYPLTISTVRVGHLQFDNVFFYFSWNLCSVALKFQRLSLVNILWERRRDKKIYFFCRRGVGRTVEFQLHEIWDIAVIFLLKSSIHLHPNGIRISGDLTLRSRRWINTVVTSKGIGMRIDCTCREGSGIRLLFDLTVYIIYFRSYYFQTDSQRENSNIFICELMSPPLDEIDAVRGSCFVVHRLFYGQFRWINSHLFIYFFTFLCFVCFFSAPTTSMLDLF